MPTSTSLSISEIKARAASFSIEFADAHYEKGESQVFLVEFFNILGISQRKVASFEHKVRLPKTVANETGFIDLLWKGQILIEMKSRGKNLQDAFQQAKDYLAALPQRELPKAVLVCDFQRFHFYDLDNNYEKTEFTLDQLADHIELFIYMAGYQKRVYKEQDPVNRKAAELMGKVHDQLKEIGYAGHDLEVYLVRLLFCMFADDTSIFGRDDLLFYLKERTAEDGSDLAPKMAEIFDVLNTPENKRLTNLDEQVNSFPYIDGEIFAERLRLACFDATMRNILIECSELDWGQISPAIFGSMFQSVMNPLERRDLGAHYTSEKNILKLIHPLFLDELWVEFRRIKELKTGQKQKLEYFHDKIASLKFLDPACGCGNFLVITYRELRLLEIAVLKELFSSDKQRLFSEHLIKVNVNQFYGIEIEEFPAQVAKVALWMMDHQMNLKVRDIFGKIFARIPLTTSPTILHGNALPPDWETIVPKNDLNYILGNPPYVGFSNMNPRQKNDMTFIFPNIKNLDYVTAWYKKAAEYIQGTNIQVAFVSTNSICQGEAVYPLWQKMFDDYHIKINFAHQTFKWRNEGRGNAAVYCVIIGFGLHDTINKKLFLYDTVTSDPQETTVKQINPYLVDGPNIIVRNRNKPLCSGVPKMVYGNKPADGGFLIIEDEDYDDFVRKEPAAKKFIRPFLGAKEYIDGAKRYCLWLIGANPAELKRLPLVRERIVNCKKSRKNSIAAGIRKFAATPTLFAQVTQPEGKNYIIVPCHSSETRKYIPIGFVSHDVIASNAVFIIPDATLYEFGILTSAIHNAWTRYVCGRLESRYRYAKEIVYNNFPWSEPTEKQREAIMVAAQMVLDARGKFPNANLAALYDPLTMPQELLKTHEHLDRMVERSYRPQKFETDTDRVTFLFELYENLTKKPAPLLPKDETGKRKKRK